MVTLNKQNQPKNGMKGKMRPCRGRCAHEGEDVPMKGKMCRCRGRCADVGEDVPMKGKMCP